ncbi:MAG: rhodanese-like domain-containing protein [Candidatus Marinimicrobia bacterium]|nr:rhodanese-like domain-containing protein [Candidatus Neomarinimicrobiota bacterium]
MLLGVSALLGVAAQTVLPNGIGLKTEITMLGTDSTAVAIPAVLINPNTDGESASNVSLAEAYSLFEDGTALFIDARSPDEFRAGHIQQSINIPVQAFMDSLLYLENLDFNRPIITYCDGEDCNASIDLAADLKMMGFVHVNFFFGGWQEWRDAGYPTEEGP